MRTFHFDMVLRAASCARRRARPLDEMERMDATRYKHVPTYLRQKIAEYAWANTVPTDGVMPSSRRRAVLIVDFIRFLVGDTSFRERVRFPTRSAATGFAAPSSVSDRAGRHAALVVSDPGIPPRVCWP